MMLSATPRQSSVVLPSLVTKEWNDNFKKVLEETDTHIAALEKNAANFHKACERLGMELTTVRSSFKEVGLSRGLLDLALEIISKAETLDSSDQSNLLAYDRALNKRPPSGPGKSELKDCTILEECLALTRVLRQRSFSDRIVFCSSNINDYCVDSVGSKQLHPVLASEFAAVGLRYSRNLAEAVGRLRH